MMATLTKMVIRRWREVGRIQELFWRLCPQNFLMRETEIENGS